MACFVQRKPQKRQQIHSFCHSNKCFFFCIKNFMLQAGSTYMQCVIQETLTVFEMRKRTLRLKSGTLFEALFSMPLTSLHILQLLKAQNASRLPGGARL